MPLPLAEIDWNTLLQNTDVVPLVCIFGIGGLISLSAIIAVQWRKAYETRLKEKMIDRGFTADEIVRVIGAHVSEKQRRQTAHSADQAGPYCS